MTRKTATRANPRKVSMINCGVTKLTRRISRETFATYKHYRRTIVISLYADTISLRLKGTRTSYEIPVTHLMDTLCRREACRIQAEKRKKKKRK